MSELQGKIMTYDIAKAADEVRGMKPVKSKQAKGIWREHVENSTMKYDIPKQAKELAKLLGITDTGHRYLILIRLQRAFNSGALEQIDKNIEILENEDDV